MISLSGSQVLVVDDEPVLSLTMGMLLEREGAIVHRAGNGVEALRLIETTPVDVMICDQNMPVMDGRTLLKTLHQRGLSVASLFFVNGVDREDTALLTRMHVRRMITKPIQPTALIDAVRSVLSELPDR